MNPFPQAKPNGQLTEQDLAEEVVRIYQRAQTNPCTDSVSTSRNEWFTSKWVKTGVRPSILLFRTRAGRHIQLLDWRIAGIEGLTPICSFVFRSASTNTRQSL